MTDHAVAPAAEDLAADPVMALLADVAKWDVQLTREAHDRAMAAEGNDEFNAQCRTYQRMARSLRQTLAIRERILRERRLAAAKASALKPAKFDHDAVGARMRVLRDAVSRVAWDEYEPEDVVLKMRDIDMALSQISLEDAEFATRPLADQLSSSATGSRFPPAAPASGATCPGPRSPPSPPSSPRRPRKTSASPRRTIESRTTGPSASAPTRNSRRPS